MEIKKIENCDYVMFPRLQRPGLKPMHVERDTFNPNRSLGPTSLGDIKVFSCSPESKECLALVHGSHKT